MAKTSIEIDSKVNELFAKTFVTQKIENDSENPIELKIYVYKKENCIFSSFSAKIGDSVVVKSKVIKKEKAQEKYTDSISSGNAAIFVSDDPTNNNRIIINMGNIPPKEEITFISEFIHYTESSDTYEFELFRNLPILLGKDYIYQNNVVKGQVEIKTKNKINKIEKKILSDKLKINEEKYLNDDEKNNYLIKYEYHNINNLSSSYLDYKERYEDLDYIPSSKIYFDFDVNEPIIYSQKSKLDEKEENYIIQYRCINKKSEFEKNEEINLNPALFIFLIDQSGSMSGSPIKVASKALLLFLQSLPAGSYYQIIGFGSSFKKYDEEPKEYNQENITNSIKLVEELRANLGGTNIYDPLQNIYNSYQTYDKINLPRNIFLLTDGEIDNKKDTLAIIEKNSDKYSIYSIGIGNYFDKDLIKNAGIIGKGNFNFCQNIDGLNEIIATEINNASSPYISNFNLKTSIDNKNIYKTNEEEIIIKKNKIVNFGYIIEKKENKEEKDNIINENKINIEIKYIENDRYKKKDKKNEEKIENYEIIPEEIQAGEELSKLIINSYILNNSKIKEDEKTKLALKYQIFTENTSLFAEVELSEQLSEEMKQKIIGDKENNQIKKLKPPIIEDKYDNYNDIYGDDLAYSAPIFSVRKCSAPRSYAVKSSALKSSAPKSYSFKSCAYKKKSAFSMPSFGFLKSIGNSIKGLFSSSKKETIQTAFEKESYEDRDIEDKNEINDYHFDMDYGKKNKNENEKEENKAIKIEHKNEEKINLNKKEDIMKIINTQDFIGGSWDLNEQTKIIKEKYEKEFELLKNIKDKNIDDKIAITILIIYFINKEHPELLKELVMIIKKGKLYIQEKTKESYENIIKEIEN